MAGEQRTLEQLGGWRGVLGSLADRHEIGGEAAAAALQEVLEGAATPAQLGALLMGLRAKGVTVDEASGMVDAMLDAASPLTLPDDRPIIDIVGTGGAPRRREAALNVSTMACFVAAGAGAPVCKHGNRRASSTSGSFDLLEALGVAVDLDAEAVARCVAEAGIGFAFARSSHPAMRHAAPVRAELGIPTVFNLLGPLSHPGRVRRQVIGVSDPAAAPLVLGVLAQRGAVRAMVVHGDGDTDELTTTGPSTIHELRDGERRTWELDPAELGLALASEDELRGGTPAENAAIAHGVLAGEQGPIADMVALNAAAGLVVAEQAEDLAEGLTQARAALADGRAAESLATLVALSGRLSSAGR